MSRICGDFSRACGVFAVLMLGIMCSSAWLTAQLPAGCRPSATGIQFADVAGEHRVAAIAAELSGIAVRRSDGQRFLPVEFWAVDPYFGTDVAGHQNIYFADVDGDGKADAIVSNKTGIAVRLSDGTQFLPFQLWAREGYFGSLTPGVVNNYFADVTGDGKADAIVVTPTGVAVRRSDGTKFLPVENWITQPYFGNLGTYFADVDGDGQADAIAVNSSGAGLIVRRSDGSKFLPNEMWTREPYFGNVGNPVYFADVNGDGKADAIVINRDGIWVRLSDGTKFLPQRIWTDRAFYGSIATAFVDVDGDGKADAVAINPTGITVRRSDGRQFLPPETWTLNPFFGDLAPVCNH
jgi:hypothetical protein